MNLGEIRVAQGGFEMMTPSGIRPVTLRCDVEGVVHVEEVTGGGVSLRPLTIHITSSKLANAPDAVEQAERMAREMRYR